MPVLVISRSRLPTPAELAALKTALSPTEEEEGPAGSLGLHLIENNKGTPTPGIFRLLFNSVVGLGAPLTRREVIELYNKPELGLPSMETYHRIKEVRGQRKPNKDVKPGCRVEWLAALLVVTETRRNGRPCRLFHPALNPAATTILFQPEEQFESPDAAAAALWTRLLDRKGWLEPSFELYETLVSSEALLGHTHPPPSS